MEHTYKEAVMVEAFEFLNNLETLKHHADKVLSLAVPVLEKHVGLCKKAGPIFLKIMEHGDNAVLKKHLPQTTDAEWLYKLVEHLEGQYMGIIHICTCVADNVKGSRIHSMCLQKLHKILSTDPKLHKKDAKVIIKTVTKLIPEDDPSEALSCFILIIEKEDYRKLVNPNDCISHLVGAMRSLREKSSFPLVGLSNVAKALYLLCNKSEEAAVQTFSLIGKLDVIDFIIITTPLKQFASVRHLIGLLAQLIISTKNNTLISTVAKTVSIILQKAEAYFHSAKITESSIAQDAELAGYLVDLVTPLCRQEQGRLLLVEEDIMLVLDAALFIKFDAFPELILKLVVFYSEFSA